jgi:tetratricopeptide (TPR) repeat protein
MSASLSAALELNTNHIPSLLLVADRHIDAEDYAQARAVLDRIRTVDPDRSEAWAYAAVVAHLEHQPTQEQSAQERALRFWPANPRVPHLIGQKLSQHYRFAEGAASQRQALQFDPNHLPAQAQLALDLLRLGQEEEGWRLAASVHEKDGYNVTAMNLVTLRDTLANFRTLTNAHFALRMTPHEAALYGQRGLELLEQARVALGERYGLELTEPVQVDFFPDQRDFAVRTFGLPENSGFLGVCFGNLITANSPAARPGRPFNWESMLWHELTHVVTLRLTRNKMPRWLSEGISVYEERRANPAWGERMKPLYRQMIDAGDTVPLSRLSGAFITPKTPAHLQFAYYQSSLAVEFLVDRFGADRLVAVLRDLGADLDLNRALEKHAGPLPTLDRDFGTYIQQVANRLAPTLGWEKPVLPALRLSAEDSAPVASLLDSSTNFYVLSDRARKLVETGKWAEAKPLLRRWLEQCPDLVGADGAYRLLAQVHRALGETRQERDILDRWADRDDEATDAYLRLMDLAAEAKDWPAVTLNARRFLAVNPLVAAPYRHLAQAGEAQGAAPAAAAAYRALLELDPANPAELHWLLARQLHALGDPAARRHLLLALEDAPRHRAALDLLLKLEGGKHAPKPAGPL